MDDRNLAGVRLISLTADVLQALEGGVEVFEQRFPYKLNQNAELARDVGKQTAALLLRSPREAPWGAYLAIDGVQQVVGTCAFKHAPTSEGVVEIAYFTFPAFEGRGYATAMAAELIALARFSPAVRRVIAHTLPEPNASGRVLEKNGLTLLGEVLDPEDGRVWRWQLELPAEPH